MSDTKQIDSGKIPLGAYIFRRLQSIGINHVFGCPGDFNLNLLDHLYTVPGMQWVGNCNELNGAYAADGYARSRGVPGALITTYGVGELSALNGIAGAYSEHVPIIHIVGTTSRLAQKARLMIHHTLGDEAWDHTTLQQIPRILGAESVFLTDDSTFTVDIDRLIEACVKTRHPAYLFVPMDTPDILVDSTKLNTPLDLDISLPGLSNTENEIVDRIIGQLKQAAQPCVLVDVLAHRYGLVEEIREILRCTGLPAYVTPLAKSIVDETSANYAGFYMGAVTPSADVKNAIENSDLVLHIGEFPSDTNTGGWTYGIARANLIKLHPKYVSIGETTWNSISFVPIVQNLQYRIKSEDSVFRHAQLCKPSVSPRKATRAVSTGPLEQSHIWNAFNSFLRENDCIIAEVGTSQFGTLGMELPSNCEYTTQLFYSSIGFTVGALLGVLVARKEQGKPGRVILFIGDGSLQMTVQELSTVFRLGFNPIIVLINNEGYTVERVIHGPAKAHNDIAAWDYQLMLRFFGASSMAKSYLARTYTELFSVLDDPHFQDSEHPRLLECVLHKYDTPLILTKQVKGSKERAQKQLNEWDRECHRSRVDLDSTLLESGLGFGNDEFFEEETNALT